MTPALPARPIHEALDRLARGLRAAPVAAARTLVVTDELPEIVAAIADRVEPEGHASSAQTAQPEVCTAAAAPLNPRVLRADVEALNEAARMCDRRIAPSGERLRLTAIHLDIVAEQLEQVERCAALLISYRDTLEAHGVVGLPIGVHDAKLLAQSLAVVARTLAPQAPGTSELPAGVARLPMREEATRLLSGPALANAKLAGDITERIVKELADRSATDRCMILTTVATGLAMDALFRRRDQRTATAMFETRISGNSKPTPPSSRSRRCRST
jgi:hypothetical protein